MDTDNSLMKIWDVVWGAGRGQWVGEKGHMWYNKDLKNTLKCYGFGYYFILVLVMDTAALMLLGTEGTYIFLLVIIHVWNKKSMYSDLTRLSQWVECRPVDWRIPGLIQIKDMYPGCGHITSRECAGGSWLMFLTLYPSPFLSVKNQYICF